MLVYHNDSGEPTVLLDNIH